MKRLLMILLVLPIMFAGCSSADKPQTALTELDVHNAVTELVGGINDGNMDVVNKYVGISNPIITGIVERAKGKVTLNTINHVTIQDNKAEAAVTIDAGIAPLTLSKEVSLNFVYENGALKLDNPLGLLTNFTL